MRDELDLRLYEHPILDFRRGKPIRIWFNDKKLLAYENETVAAALYASGIKVLRRSIKYGRPRGFFCGIGKCSSCLMSVNEVPNTRACITPAKDGMIIKYQRGKGEVEIGYNVETKRAENLDAEIVVVGAGPAGLSAAIYASRFGGDVVVIDENSIVGGQLIKQTHKFFGSEKMYAGMRGIDIAKVLLSELRKTNSRWILNASVIGHFNGRKHEVAVIQKNEKLIVIRTEKIIVATGAMENMLAFQNNDLPGVCGAGGIQTLMNVYGVKPGNEALVVGAGNVGLIISYQLLQAGVNVKAVVEAMPRIGGYLVHASKLRRSGVPILTSHTIKGAMGKNFVEKATIVRLDERGMPVEGSEQGIDVDLICLAVGLTPSSEMPSQAGCESAYISELGGNVALHDENLQTTVNGIYIAGDVSGIEEATTAMLEGKVAGADAAIELGKGGKKVEEIKKEAFNQLELFRASPFSARVRKGKEKVWAMMRDRE